MKVLFAVSNENISTQIVKRYQKEYKEIISYKNMYYFNAIIKELQRDKSYDRIVISEDLEPFANNNYDEIEKFLFEKLDNISDEATRLNGDDIPIILLASDKRTKSESILVKLFGIGIYDVLLGQDRTTDNVCRLLNKPRGKKEAKIYYKIESDEVSYKSESEDNVSEVEIKNILNHYRKLGKDEERYIESFNNIAAQYNDSQLRIITKFLPLNVKAVLEERSPKYQSVMTFSDVNTTSDLMKKNKEEEGLKIGFLNYANSSKPIEPVIVPTAVKKVAAKKISKNIETPKDEWNNNEETLEGFEDILEIPDTTNLQEIEEPVKRGRGRPRKQITETEASKVNVVKRGRGRPRKVVENIDESEDILPGFDNVEDTTLPGFDDVEDSVLPGFDEVEDTTLPGFNDVEDTTLPGFDEVKETTLASFEDVEDSILPGFDDVKDITSSGFNDIKDTVLPSFEKKELDKLNTNISGLLTKDRKIVSFVGTTKNGTSFLINNIAKCLSSKGIKTAILDLTTNRNSYYIYTKNEEKLRNIAFESIKNLREGVKNGITVDKYLDVYTALPGDEIPLEDVETILSTLIQNYSVILMDCDFNTLDEYFKIAQEIYIVQSKDIFTIQPMTAFLRDLKAKNILEEEKIKIIINKEVKVSGLTPKMIVDGLSNYNDPAMSFMTELFDRNTAKYCIVPFYEEVYSKYLEGIMNCEITINSYPKAFKAKLNELASWVYPLLGNKNKYSNGYSYENTFSTDINNTLEEMKKRY